MAITPITFNANGSVGVWHDEADHGGTIPAADVRFAENPDGTDDLRYIVLDCPVAGCDSVSVHPCGGGCDPQMVQRMFARKLKKVPARPSVPGLENVPNRPWEDAKRALRSLVTQMDGRDRYKLEDVAENE